MTRSTPSSGMTQDKRKTTKQRAPCETKHSPADWEGIREKFTGLYQSDLHTLAQIRAIFSAQGFEATERQYKRKIESWKLEKKVKPDEKEFMVRKEAQRLAEQGKQTIFLHKGRVVKDHKLAPTRKKLASKQEDSQTITRTPEHILYKTPEYKRIITAPTKSSVSPQSTEVSIASLWDFSMLPSTTSRPDNHSNATGLVPKAMKMQQVDCALCSATFLDKKDMLIPLLKVHLDWNHPHFCMLRVCVLGDLIYGWSGETESKSELSEVPGPEPAPPSTPIRKPLMDEYFEAEVEVEGEIDATNISNDSTLVLDSTQPGAGFLPDNEFTRQGKAYWNPCLPSTGSKEFKPYYVDAQEGEKAYTTALHRMKDKGRLALLGYIKADTTENAERTKACDGSLEAQFDAINWFADCDIPYPKLPPQTPNQESSQKIQNSPILDFEHNPWKHSSGDELDEDEWNLFLNSSPPQSTF